MHGLITATQCLKMLKEKDRIVRSKSYFSQMVSDGRIPHHSKPGSPKKFFRYEEVKQAIEDSKDPTRAAQREANDRKRSEPDAGLLDLAGQYPSVADMSAEEKATAAEEARRLREEAEAAKREAIAAGAADETKTSSLPGDITQAAAKAEKEYWLGKKAEVEYKKLVGEFVSVKEIERQAFEIARTVRDAVLAIPARVAPIIAAEKDPFVVKEKLLQELNQALGDLCHE